MTSSQGQHNGHLSTLSKEFDGSHVIKNSYTEYRPPQVKLSYDKSHDSLALSFDNSHDVKKGK